MVKRKADEAPDVPASSEVSGNAGGSSGGAGSGSARQPPLGAKKRARRGRGQSKPCFSWAKTGTCKYAGKCRFSHRPEDAGTGVPGGTDGKDEYDGRAPPWPDNRDPFGDVVHRNYTELFLRRESRGFDAPTAESARSAESLSVPSALSCTDQYVHLHPNHLCVVGIAPTHAALQKGRTITKITYGTLRGADLAVVKTSGKKKRGSLRVKSDTMLATIACDDGTSWSCLAAVDGNLIEVNASAIEDASVISREPSFSGYIAIIQPKSDHLLRKNIQALENPAAARPAAVPVRPPGSEKVVVTGASNDPSDSH